MTSMIKRKIQLGPVPAKQLKQNHPDLFGDMSEAFLEWNRGAVVRRVFRNGEVICKQGEYGSTAYVIEYGTVEVRLDTGAKQQQPEPGFVSRLMGWGTKGENKAPTGTSPDQIINLIDVPISLNLASRSQR